MKTLRPEQVVEVLGVIATLQVIVFLNKSAT